VRFVRDTLDAFPDLGKWTMSTFSGHVILFQACTALTICVTMEILNYQQGTLTTPWAIYVAAVSVGLV
jgi:hypothetical protein